MTSSLAEKQTIDSQCVLGAKPPLIEGVSDYTLSLVIPIVTHWLTSAFYEVLERFNLLQKYKIHSNAEETAKNPISRVECLRGVLLVQVLQTGLGIVLGYLSDEEIICNDDKDVMIWANRVHGAGKMTLTLLSYCGLDAAALSAVCLSALRTASMLSGQTELDLEWLVAKIIYHGLMPALRFYSALWLADTWVFFIHRAEHSSPWLYRNFHARHHELYVPYSWGGIYDHPAESLFLSVGAFVIAVMGTGMPLRESMVFSAFSSAKACTDHGGYKFPWNPIDAFTSVGAAYHDKHHQRWGLKKNFALHFQFWDDLLGTKFTDTEAAERLYVRDRKAAEMGKDGREGKVKSL